MVKIKLTLCAVLLRCVTLLIIPPVDQVMGESLEEKSETQDNSLFNSNDWNSTCGMQENRLFFSIYLRTKGNDLKPDDLITVPMDMSAYRAFRLSDLAIEYSNELQLSEKQRSELGKSSAKARENLIKVAWQIHFEELNAATAEKLVADYVNSVNAYVQDDILIRSQRKRLSELEVFHNMFGGSLVRGLAKNEVRKRLDVDDEQMKSLLEKKIELEEEFLAELNAMTEKYRHRFLESLTIEQVRDIEKAVGEERLLDDEANRKKQMGQFRLFLNL